MLRHAGPPFSLRERRAAVSRNAVELYEKSSSGAAVPKDGLIVYLWMYDQLKSGGLGPLSVFPYVPVSALLPAFLKRKPADGLGFQGGPLGASLPPFSAPRKKVSSRPDPFCRACWCLSAHINRCPNEKGYPMRGHPLLPRAAKVGKKAPGGFPPAPRLPADFFYENRRQREHLNQRL